MTDELTIRRLHEDDADEEAAVLEMLAGSLGWVPDGTHRDFYRWKHHDNPAGRSPTWVAVDGGRIAGVRVLLRWRFRDGDGVTHDAVRAVDTATDPAYRGRGIFRTLTLQAVEELSAEGTGFVFNTPNDQSLPGYLKMGWTELGRVPIAMRPRSLTSLWPLARARTAAELWSQPTDAHRPASQVLADTDGVEALLSRIAPPSGLTTDRTVAHLRWRYGYEPLRYRAVAAPDGVAAGLVVYRLRRRGAALEAAIVERLVPHGDRRTGRRLVGEVLRASRADYTVAMSSGPADAMVPVPGQGPVLTRRPLADPTVGTIDAFTLALGDIELF